mgnify:CR=1 FL=1
MDIKNAEDFFYPVPGHIVAEEEDDGTPVDTQVPTIPGVRKIEVYSLEIFKTLITVAPDLTEKDLEDYIELSISLGTKLHKRLQKSKEN